MKRQFNYTTRKKIGRSRVKAELHLDPTGTRRFTAVVNLQGLGLPAQARVFVEAYVQRSLVRFDFGTAANPQPPSHTELTDLDSSSQVFFRVKVVDDSAGHGLVLAVADNIRPVDASSDPSSRQSLLDVVYAVDMGQQLWAVDFNDASGPFLKINAQLPDATQFMKTPQIRAIVLPSVLRDVLNYLTFVRGGDLSDDDSDTWPGKWLAMVRTWHREEAPIRDDDTEDDWPAAARDWIESAVRSFSNRQETLRHFLPFEQKEVV